jgi:hypothetical protein
MVGRHVLGQGGMGAAPLAPRVRSDALAAMEYLDRRRGVTNVDLFASEAMRDRVVMVNEFDVVVNVFCG